MVAAARDRLARMLRGDVASAFSVELRARPDDLALEVDGFGPVKLPVTPAKARKLLGLGQPARFGRGEETVTDPEVRDTWEIPRDLVRATWNPAMLDVILKTIQDELGLPTGVELTADLHSLLVYEPDQFFLAHQDSEKDDAMVGTLVVTLPSNYRGGELMVGHNEEWKAYQGSKTMLSLVALYADCQHEVLRVQSGYRITLTYNLLVHGDTSRPDGEEGKLAELSALLREHFSTPAPRYAYGEPADPPNRLVYLLDHEYTPRALGWTRLKGADAARVSLLRTAAERAGYEAILALADVKTTHSAYPEDEYGYRRRGWYHDDEDDDEYGHDWTADLLGVWFGGSQPVWAYVGTERQRWVSDRLRGLCEALDALSDGAGVTARLLLDLCWAWLRKDIDAAMGLSSPSTRGRMLGDRARPLAAVLTTAALLGSAGDRVAILEHLTKQDAPVIVLELSTLRAVTAAPASERPAAGALDDAGFRDLAADCAARLRARLAAPQRADGDWSIGLPPGGYTCELCATLTAFLSDTRRRTFEWPLAKPGRQHIHGRIDTAELPVTHVTRRQGKPYTLVLTKTEELFTGDRSARDAAAADLEWLTRQWNLTG